MEPFHLFALSFLAWMGGYFAGHAQLAVFAAKKDRPRLKEVFAKSRNSNTFIAYMLTFGTLLLLILISILE